MVSSDVTSAAFVQRSRTLAPSWRDASGNLVRGGVLQLQKNGVPMCISLGAPPGKLLALDAEPPCPVESQLQRSSSFAARPSEKHQRAPKALRDRMAVTSDLPEALKEECLERLDSIAARVLPTRRPS